VGKLDRVHIVMYIFNMHSHYYPRRLEKKVRESLERFPATAVLGPRQCGKTRMAKDLLDNFPGSVYLDLERPSDRRMLADPELFFEHHRGRLVCLDEIQRVPELFPVLRSVLDAGGKPGQVLLLGSASQELLRQSSESLAGRICYLELTPFLPPELGELKGILNTLWVRGGFPPSVLAASREASMEWRRQFIRTFLERDIPQLGVRIPSPSIERLWSMCAHLHGQLLNLSQIGEALGVSHPTVRHHLDLLSETYMVRLLPPLLPNLRKRLIKSPKVFVRDTGILHALLDVDDYSALLGHPVVGASWEGWVIETVLAAAGHWQGFFYRTAKGAEMDLVLERGRRRLAVECKVSKAPGFHSALKDLKIKKAWVIAPVEAAYPLSSGVMVGSPLHLLASGDLE
jgi:predicted AAA+ superfamily ATPase